jgi:hypothetical protein
MSRNPRETRTHVCLPVLAGERKATRRVGTAKCECNTPNRRFDPEDDVRQTSADPKRRSAVEFSYQASDE